MPTIKEGPRTWSMERDDEGHREYKIRWIVLADSIEDGPANILQTPGLPEPGDTWLVGQDIDVWAWCRPTTSVRILQEREGDPNVLWQVDQTFSTKPPGRDRTRAQDTKIEDPLIEPPKIGGGMHKDKEEGIVDAAGRLITNSSWELIRGPQNEWDSSRPTLSIEHNVASLDFVLCSSMVDCVNDQPIFGFQRRCVKLSEFTWDRRYIGRNSVYWNRRFVFEINTKTWDREILDEGQKVLRGKWGDDGSWVLADINGDDPQQSNPAHFMRSIDRQGNPCKVILDGAGKPYDVAAGSLSKFLDDGQQYVGDIANEFQMVPPLTSTATITSPTGVTATPKPGGGLGGGPFSTNFVYVVTAIQDNGVETLVAANESATAFVDANNDPNGSILVEWNAVLGAIGYRIYAARESDLPSLSSYTPADNAHYKKIYERSGRPGTIRVAKYRAVNFQLLGLPLLIE
jgi:hypothetical protein